MELRWRIQADLFKGNIVNLQYGRGKRKENPSITTRTRGGTLTPDWTEAKITILYLRILLEARLLRRCMKIVTPWTIV